MPNTNKLLKLTCPYTDNEYQGTASRYLFVCSAGMLRSATAAKIAHSLGYNARAAGSEEYALIPINANLIVWADTIFFLQEENYLSVLDTFPMYSTQLKEKSIVWDIEDIYSYNDPILINTITKLLS